METRICSKCGEEKALDLFARHALSAKGRTRDCKQCRSTEYKLYKREKKEYIKARNKAYYEKNKERLCAYKKQKRKDVGLEKTESRRLSRLKYTRTMRALYPEKFKARSAIKRAIRSGKIKRLPCEICGDKNTHGHHEDYSKPMEVKWLCPLHHRIAHGKTR